MENNKKLKRFYKINEVVWVIPEKKEGTIKKIDRENLEVLVEVKEDKLSEQINLKMWEIDKLKYSAKDKLLKEKKKNEYSLSNLYELINKIFFPKVYFAKLRDSVVIPTKRLEDAGYDLYANLDQDKFKREDEDIWEIKCPLLKTTLVPTGLAMALPTSHYFNLKHERGSTAVQSMGVLAGVVDSGFRNEMFIAITPMNKQVIITSAVTSVEEDDVNIYYPLCKAVAQGTIDLVPEAQIIVKTYEELLKIESERGMTMLGQSGK